MGVVARRPGRRDASCERAKARSDDILHESFHASSSSRARSREGRRSDARSFDRTRRRSFVVSRHATRARDDANDDRGDEGFPKCRAVERPRATRVHAVRSRATSIPSTRSRSIARTRSIANSTARTRANRTFLTFDPRGRRRRTKILDGSVWCVRARAFVVRERRERERERTARLTRTAAIASRVGTSRDVRANSSARTSSETNITETSRLNRDETGGWCPRTRTITPPRTFLADGTDGCITRTTNRGYRTPPRRRTRTPRRVSRAGRRARGRIFPRDTFPARNRVRSRGRGLGTNRGPPIGDRGGETTTRDVSTNE